MRILTQASLAGLLAMFVSMTCAGQNGSSQNTSNGAFHPEKVAPVSPLNVRPDANKQLEMNGRRVQQQTFSAANTERKRQMSDDAARLLQFAAELNAQLAKDEPASSRQAAIAKADMIEKLAHEVKQKMKLTVAAQ